MNDRVLSDEVKKANKELHNIEAQYYDLLHPEIWNSYEQWQVRRDIRKIAKLLRQKPVNVLDVGCGTGNLALKFLKAGCSVTALDISEEMLRKLSMKIPEPIKDKVQLICEDVDTLLLTTDKLYDVICFSSVLHHLPDYFYTLKLAVQQLREHGIIYIIHEPFSPQSGFIQNYRKRFLSLVDGYLNHRRLARQAKNLELPALNYSVADVYSKEGINPQEVSRFLMSIGMEVVCIKKYANYKSRLVCLFGELLFDTSQFKIIIRKERG